MKTYHIKQTSLAIKPFGVAELKIEGCYTLWADVNGSPAQVALDGAIIDNLAVQRVADSPDLVERVNRLFVAKYRHIASKLCELSGA